MKSFKRRGFILFVSVVLLVALSVGGTYAYLTVTSKSLVNTFTVPGGSTPEIKETFNTGDTEKQDVSVKVSGTIDSLVRVRLVVSLQDDSGNTVAKTPVLGTDYTVSYNATDWTKSGDYYYYNKVIQGNGETNTLFYNITTLNKSYKLVVNVMAQTIQASGGAANEAWKMNYSNGSWTAVS